MLLSRVTQTFKVNMMLKFPENQKIKYRIISKLMKDVEDSTNEGKKKISVEKREIYAK